MFGAVFRGMNVLNATFTGRKTNNSYEDGLGRIESDAKSILPEFIASQQIKPSEAAVWSYFLASLFWRTRKVRSQISSLMVSKLRAETKTDKFLREVQYAAFKKGELIFKDELRERINSFQKKFEETPYYHVSGLPQHTHVLPETIARKNWHTISAPSGKYFATSDCPVVTVERKERSWELGAGFDKDNVIVFLPLTERKLFVAASASFGFKSTVPDVAADSFNLSTVRFAHRNVYAHQNSDDLKTLVNLEINKIEFGKNAFT